MIIEQFDQPFKFYDELTERFDIEFPVEKLTRNLAVQLKEEISQRLREYRLRDSFMQSDEYMALVLLQRVVEETIRHDKFLFEDETDLDDHWNNFWQNNEYPAPPDKSFSKVKVKGTKRLKGVKISSTPTPVIVAKDGQKYMMFGSKWEHVDVKSPLADNTQKQLTAWYGSTPEDGNSITAAGQRFVYIGSLNKWCAISDKGPAPTEKTTELNAKAAQMVDKLKAHKDTLAANPNAIATHAAKSMATGIVSAFVAGLRKQPLRTDIGKQKFQQYELSLEKILSHNPKPKTFLASEIQKHFSEYTNKNVIYKMLSKVYSAGVSDPTPRSIDSIERLIATSSDHEFDGLDEDRKDSLIAYTTAMYKAIQANTGK